MIASERASWRKSRDVVADSAIAVIARCTSIIGSAVRSRKPSINSGRTSSQANK
jgi:hypothetical protein